MHPCQRKKKKKLEHRVAQSCLPIDFHVNALWKRRIRSSLHQFFLFSFYTFISSFPLFRDCSKRIESFFIFSPGRVNVFMWVFLTLLYPVLFLFFLSSPFSLVNVDILFYFFFLLYWPFCGFLFSRQEGLCPVVSKLINFSKIIKLFYLFIYFFQLFFGPLKITLHILRSAHLQDESSLWNFFKYRKK